MRGSGSVSSTVASWLHRRYMSIGDSLFAHLTALTQSQLKLLTIYINRTLKSRGVCGCLSVLNRATDVLTWVPVLQTHPLVVEQAQGSSVSVAVSNQHTRFPTTGCGVATCTFCDHPLSSRIHATSRSCTIQPACDRGNPESGAMSRLVVQSVVKALGLASTDATASQPRQLADIECDEGTDAVVDVLIPLFVLCLMCVLQCEGYPVRGAKISHTLYL